MPIIVNLDVMMAKRHMGAGELAETIGITPANLSILKTTKQKRCGFPPWKPCAKRWIASPLTCWNTARTKRKETTLGNTA